MMLWFVNREEIKKRESWDRGAGAFGGGQCLYMGAGVLLQSVQSVASRGARHPIFFDPEAGPCETGAR